MGKGVENYGCFVSKSLQCSICSGVLEKPVQLQVCEHIFCEACLLEWFLVKTVCPLCMRATDPHSVRKPPRVIVSQPCARGGA